METLAPAFTTHRFDVELITPVHVGMAQEKHYQHGLDYVLDNNGQCLLVNTEKLFGMLTASELQNLTLRLADGRTDPLEKLLNQLLNANPGALMQKLPMQDKPADGIIRRMYRTGLGRYALPGSSLKGAIRSVLLAELKKQPGSNRRHDELDKLMGGIDSNLMRYLQVGDVHLPDQAAAIRRIKVFSADSEKHNMGTRGEWKHGQKGNHKPAFAAEGFVTFYEVMVPGADTADSKENVLTLRLGSHLPHYLGGFAAGTTAGKENVPNYRKLLAGKPGTWLTDTIRAHTKQYLEREKAYFRMFANADLDKAEPIMDTLDALLAHNAEAGSCLLRVGAGVGFHSITGDWQQRSQDHHSEWNSFKNAIHAKTRKFAFHNQDGTVDFSLMGFIKLTLQSPASAAAREAKQALAREKADAQRLAAEAAARLAARAAAEQEEARHLALENQKRQQHDGKVKKGIAVNAEVVKTAGPKATLKLLVPGHEADSIELRYPDLAPGDFLTVEVKDVSGKGKIMAVAFKSKY